MSCEDVRRDIQASHTKSERFPHPVRSTLSVNTNVTSLYEDYVPYDHIVQPKGNDLVGKQLYDKCRGAQAMARWTIGVRTFQIIPTQDGHIIVDGREIKRWAPEFQIFRSDKFSKPRDPFGKLFEHKVRADSVVAVDSPMQSSMPEQLQSSAEAAREPPAEAKDQIACQITRELNAARARPLVRPSDQSGQDPVTGEVNPRLAELINHPMYKIPVDQYFAHLLASHKGWRRTRG